MKLTEKQIEQIVEAVKSTARIEVGLMSGEIMLKDIPVSVLTTALATIDLDQPKQIDLNEVEKLLKSRHEFSTVQTLWRKRIGYTLSDLTPNTTEKWKHLDELRNQRNHYLTSSEKKPQKDLITQP